MFAWVWHAMVSGDQSFWVAIISLVPLGLGSPLFVPLFELYLGEFIHAPIIGLLVLVTLVTGFLFNRD